MTTYIATLYIPGKPALSLTTEQVSQFFAEQMSDGIYCHESEVKKLLQVADVNTVYSDAKCSIYGVSNAAGYEAQHTPEAEHAATGLLGEWCDFSGPVLIVQQATPQQPPVVGGLTTVSTQADRWAPSQQFTLLHGKAGFFVHITDQPLHGPYTPADLQGGRFEEVARTHEAAVSAA